MPAGSSYLQQTVSHLNKCNFLQACTPTLSAEAPQNEAVRFSISTDEPFHRHLFCQPLPHA